MRIVQMTTTQSWLFIPDNPKKQLAKWEMKIDEMQKKRNKRDSKSVLYNVSKAEQKINGDEKLRRECYRQCC